MMGAVIEAKELSKWFGEAVAVNNLNLRIERGVTGLLGPNGAGKSTFMKLALGLYEPSRGEIRVFGRPPRNNMRVLQRIGYCPEIDALQEDMTGYEFVYWQNRHWGMRPRDARRRAQEVCAQVKMTLRMHDPVSEYSRGMRQRIKIAQALAMEPELLFLDEPMAGLDPQGREEMFALIQGLGREGHTVVVSSHVLYEVERVTRNVILLHNGCMLAYGPIQHIRELIAEHPRTITVECEKPRALAARFLGDEGLMSVEFAQKAFTVRTTEVDAFSQKLNNLILDESAAVAGIHCVDENLQSIFDYLVT